MGEERRREKWFRLSEREIEITSNSPVIQFDRIKYLYVSLQPRAKEKEKK